MRCIRPLLAAHAAALAVGAVLAVVQGLCGPARAAGPAVDQPQGTITFETLLSEMTDREALARWPGLEYRMLQSSSHDRRSREGDLPSTRPTDDGWFANGDFGKYLRVEHVNGRKEKVLMDARGPGAIVRIWSANPDQGGTLRIYLDESSEPVIQENFRKLIDGTGPIAPPLSAARARGHNLYLPIPFAKRCKVTLDGDPQDRVYYVINYRKYEADVQVQSLGAGDLQKHGELIFRANRQLSAPAELLLSTPITGRSRAESRGVISPSGVLTQRIGTGPMALRELKVTLEDVKAATIEQSLRALVLKITADDEATLVEAPLSDFFGSGVGLNAYEDWYRTVTADGVLSCRWVMPFRNSMTLSLVNHGPEPIGVALEYTATSWEWDDRSMYFRANFRQERDIPTRPRQDFNYLQVEGQGVFVGDTLAVANPTPVWWGEGDEKVYVDGEKFPSHIGTGSEDYYGYAWCCPETFAGPFHAQPRCDGPDNFGHTTNTRVRLMDAIPFGERFQLDIEVWHWQDVRVSYAATTYWYGRPGAKAIGPAASAEKDLSVPELPQMHRLADAIEGERLKVIGKSAEFTAGTQMLFGSFEGNWSGGQHLWIQADEAGQWVDVEVPTAAGEQELTVWMTRAPDYGMVQLHIDGREIGEPIDLYAGQVEPTGPISVGTFTPQGQKAALRIELVGTNEKSTGKRYFAGLDAVRLAPAK